MRTYRSESARATAVFKYFIFSWFASLFTYSCFLAVCAAADIVNIMLVSILIAAQLITWVTMGTGMCMVYDSLDHPPTPKEKTPEKIDLTERIIPVFVNRK